MSEPTEGLGPVDADKVESLNARARELLDAIADAEAVTPDETMTHHRMVASLFAQFHSVMAVLWHWGQCNTVGHTAQHHEYLKQVSRMVNAEKQDKIPEVLRRLAALEDSENKLQAIP